MAGSVPDLPLQRERHHDCLEPRYKVPNEPQAGGTLSLLFYQGDQRPHQPIACLGYSLSIFPFFLCWAPRAFLLCWLEEGQQRPREARASGRSLPSGCALRYCLLQRGPRPAASPASAFVSAWRLWRGQNGRGCAGLSASPRPRLPQPRSDHSHCTCRSGPCQAPLTPSASLVISSPH